MICSLCLEPQSKVEYANFNFCHFAAFNGHDSCLECAHQNGYDMDINVCIFSIVNGHVECLKYAHLNGGIMHTQACELAARYGKLECMKYILENGGSVDNSCHWAARYGHLECLQFAHQNGGTLQDNFDDKRRILQASFKIALKKGHYDCFQYAFANMDTGIQLKRFHALPSDETNIIVNYPPFANEHPLEIDQDIDLLQPPPPPPIISDMYPETAMEEFDDIQFPEILMEEFDDIQLLLV